ncbi:hypothetical protein [uncultured Mediterranean phage uvDeep-CGR2-KM19-C269]|nr:hypothetical protein [uncultured Mediterranean phage uvDeep-CGR2-KM19-C269]
MFATQNIQLKFLKLIIIIIKTMINIIAVSTYFTTLFLYMFVNHLTEGIDNINEAIKLDEDDINSVHNKK